MKRYILLAFLLFFLSACQEDGPGLTWEKIRAQDVAQVTIGWSEPVYLEISELGWVDSLQVSQDGETVYYFYYPGLYLMADIKTRDFKGDGDIYMSRSPFKTQQAIKKYDLSEKIWTSCCIQIDADGNYWYVSNRDGRPGGWVEGDYDNENIYRNGKRLAFNEKKGDPSNPHYCKAKDELWFDCKADTDLCVLKNAAANNFSGKPGRAPVPLNAKKGGGNLQPFLTTDCNTIYFTSGRGGKGPAIYKSDRLGEDQWSEPQSVVRAQTGVGEPTLTADERKLFFVQLFKNKRVRSGSAHFILRKKGNDLLEIIRGGS